jgi:membrane fusion protein, copper/silver efflux system
MRTPARFLAIAFMAVGIFIAGYLANRQKDPPTSSASTVATTIYACPMHPQYRSDHIMDCPICGMRLEPVIGGNLGSSSSMTSTNNQRMVQVNAEKQQLIGVRIEEVRRTSASYQLRVPGRITVDDQRLHRIIAATDGWILDLEPYTAGHFVKKNQLLASYYTKDLLGTERLFLVSLGGSETPQNMGGNSPSIRVGASLIPQYPVDSLRGIGMSDLQIREIQQSRTAAPNIKIYSPVTGYVLARDISPEQRFDKGTEFYRIADISHVWVVTDIFEKDREFIKPGATATIQYQGLELHAHISDALPQFDPESRILKTRFELDNPGSMLLPGMFVEVALQMETPEAIIVPGDAVIDSGCRKTVYVEHGSGMFEPRLVETGWRHGNQIQISKGLAVGERIAVSGNFLIDSESRMKSLEGANPTAPEKAHTAKDLVCGMDVDPKSPHTLQHQYKGKTYYFCGEMCKKRFEAAPAKYVPEQAAKQTDKVKDLVCGMDINPNAAGTLKTSYKGKTYYFCSKQCKIHFEVNPEEYVHTGIVSPNMHMPGMTE